MLLVLIPRGTVMVQSAACVFRVSLFLVFSYHALKRYRTGIVQPNHIPEARERFSKMQRCIEL